MEQRDFTQDELDILQFAGFTTYGNMAWLEDRGFTGVQVFALRQPFFMVHQETSCDVHFRASLKDIIACANTVLKES